MTKVNDKGYQLTDIEQLISDYKTFITDNFTGLNVDSEAPMGQFALMHAYLLDEFQKDTQAVYNSFDLDSASGLDLDKLGKIIGLERIAFVPTTVTTDVTSSSTPYTLVSGSRFVLNKDESVIFEILSDTLIDASPKSIGLSSISYEEIDIEVGDKMKPVDVIPQILDMEITAFIDGFPAESDFAYRQRLKQVTGGNGLGGTQRMNNAIFDVENVTSAIVFDKNSDVSIPLGQVKAIVDGGDNIEIANAILNSLDMGCITIGSTTETIPDYNNNPIDIKFTRPSQKQVTFELEVTLITGLTADQRQQIVDGFILLCDRVPIGGTLFYQDVYGLIVSIVTGTANITSLTVDGSVIDVTSASDEKIIADPTITPEDNISIV